MPESVTDRCTKAHEYIFLFSKSPKCHFDSEAIKEPSKYPNDDRKGRVSFTDKRLPTGLIAGIRPGSQTYPFRNKRSVWTVTTKPYKGAHFATFPPDLIEPCILAGAPIGGVAIVLDVFTKKVMGWSIALSMEESLVMEALVMALKKGTPMYHHTDRGGQYCANEHVEKLENLGVKISMADTGVSVDNPFAESFNRTLKVEEVYLHDYQNLDEARASIGDFIKKSVSPKKTASVTQLPDAG
ncbi:MAG: hypothetical protein DLM68_15585 [Hyphomicrobiales bacterium]|nr:MAG: hypothetical protein DLM68_15585 [Hyphomicrobiales bacterium]